MSTIASLIQQHAATQAAAGNWAAVADVLNARSLQGPGNRITGKQTIVGLAVAGVDSDRIRSVLEATPSGRGLLGLLDAGQSVDWLDTVTVAALAKNTGSGALSDADVLALKSLSRRVPAVTAEQCQLAMFRDPLEARVVNASALMLERASLSDTPQQLAAKWSQAWTEAV